MDEIYVGSMLAMMIKKEITHFTQVTKMSLFGEDAKPFWQNGPSPGAFYHFPGPSCGTGGVQHSQCVLFDCQVLVYLSNLFSNL